MSLLADLTPISLNEPLDTGDKCWCESYTYAQSYSLFREDWCFCSGQPRPHGRRIRPYPDHDREFGGRYQDYGPPTTKR